MIELHFTDTRSLVLLVRRKAVKIPFSKGGLTLNRREQERIVEVKKDPFFAQFLCGYRFFGGINVSDRLPIPKRDRAFLQRFFNNYFKEHETWDEITLKEIIYWDHLKDFIEQNFSLEEVTRITTFCALLRVPRSSVHGDLHAGNIFQKEGQFYLIDWGHYRLESCRYFDLIDFHVVADETRPWGESWVSFLDSLGPVELAGVGVSRQLLEAFVLWKIAKEIKTVELLNLTLSEKKIHKYKELIRKLLAKWTK